MFLPGISEFLPTSLNTRVDSKYAAGEKQVEKKWLESQKGETKRKGYYPIILLLSLVLGEFLTGGLLRFAYNRILYFSSLGT